MAASTRSRRGSQQRHLADAVAKKREALRSQIVALAAPADEQNVLVHAVADGLIDRFCKAAEDGTWLPIVRWADATCSRRPRPAVRRLLRSLVPAINKTLEYDGFGDLHEALTTIAERAADDQTHASTEVIDEVDVVLTDLLGRIESNDPKTAEHCRAVSAWCARIARRMSLTRGESTLVARGGLVHDVGKAKTPAEILNAPRRLTDEETEVMRQHTLAGHDIIKSYPKLSDLVPMVRSHHERFDGQGYPDRLDRTRIPVFVRIVSVADSFNAMIGRRPYRSPFSPSHATAELLRGAGTQFDPDVVRALLDVVGFKERTDGGSAA